MRDAQESRKLEDVYKGQFYYATDQCLSDKKGDTFYCDRI